MVIKCGGGGDEICGCVTHVEHVRDAFNLLLGEPE